MPTESSRAESEITATTYRSIEETLLDTESLAIGDKRKASVVPTKSVAPKDRTAKVALKAIKPNDKSVVARANEMPNIATVRRTPPASRQKTA